MRAHSVAMLCAAMLGVNGCSANLADGRFTCGPGVECPSGFACHADARCYRGVQLFDSSMTDAAMADAGPDIGTDAPGTDADVHDAPGADGCSAICSWGCSGTTCDAAVAVVAGAGFSCEDQC